MPEATKPIHLYIGNIRFGGEMPPEALVPAKEGLPRRLASSFIAEGGDKLFLFDFQEVPGDADEVRLSLIGCQTVTLVQLDLMVQAVEGIGGGGQPAKGGA